MNKMAGITMVHVPYKGSAPAMIDSISGQCQVHIASLITSLPHVREGRVRGIGVTSAKRSAAAPDIPAIAETLPGYEVVNSYYLPAPAGLPADVHTKLHADAVKAIRHPEVVERLARDGADPVGNTPAQATRYIEGEIQKWGKAVRESGAKADG
jgi:tripartite-type tricarboxylate transporter receptor subunit TctC